MGLRRNKVLFKSFRNKDTHGDLILKICLISFLTFICSHEFLHALFNRLSDIFEEVISAYW